MIGLILFAYGGPNSMDDLLSYYIDIHHGRVPDETYMEEVKNKYRHIGEGNLLGAVTKRQGEALQHALQPYLNEEIKSYVAFKHTPPYVKDTVEQMLKDGVKKIITFPIKPLYSKMGIRFYQNQVRKTLEELQMEVPIMDIEHWHMNEGFIDVIASRVKTAYEWLPRDVQNNAYVLFTAHSQPGLAKTHEVYIRQFQELAKAVAEKLSLNNWETAFRSLGKKKELWLGPDVQDVVPELAKKGCTGIVACDLLSITTNMEVLYDIGYDLLDVCRELNIELVRTTFLNDSYDFIQVLKRIVIEKVKEEQPDWIQSNVQIPQ